MKTVKTTPQWSMMLVVVTALGVSILFFSPAFWLMREPIPGSFQWTRALGYLSQCEDPFRADVEIALRWRLLPPTVAKVLGLSGFSALWIPWLGVLAATSYVAVLYRRRLDDRRWVFAGTLLFTTTSAVLVPFGWLGINDAWVWLALLAVGFGQNRFALPTACLLAPWVDERFLIGFPLAWLVRHLDRDEPWRWSNLGDGCWFLPYVGLRVYFSLISAPQIEAEGGFLASTLISFPITAAHAPLGWWMGLRVAWLPLAYALIVFRSHSLHLLTVTATCATLFISTVLASDLSRSVAILTPLVVVGCFTWAKRHPEHATMALLPLAGANLLVPAAHVVFNKISLIYPFPVELIRFLR